MSLIDARLSSLVRELSRFRAKIDRHPRRVEWHDRWVKGRGEGDAVGDAGAEAPGREAS